MSVPPRPTVPPRPAPRPRPTLDLEPHPLHKVEKPILPVTPPHPLRKVTPLPAPVAAAPPDAGPRPVPRPSAPPSLQPIARRGLPPEPSRTPRTVALLGVGLLAVWAVPALGLGLLTAGRALVQITSAEATVPQPSDAPATALTWDDIDRAEDQRIQLHPKKTTPSTPTVPTVPTAEVTGTAPLTLTLDPGLFATTATARCPDGTGLRATFENGVATFPAIPRNEVCRVTFQGGGTSTTLRTGPGALRCSLVATTGSLLCR